MTGGRIGSDMNDSVSLGSDSRPAVARSKPNKSRAHTSSSPAASSTTTNTRSREKLLLSQIPRPKIVEGRSAGSGASSGLLTTTLSGTAPTLSRRTREAEVLLASNKPKHQPQQQQQQQQQHPAYGAAKPQLSKTSASLGAASGIGSTSRPRSSSAPPMRRSAR